MQRELKRHGIGRTGYPAASAVPALIGIGDGRLVLIHDENISRTAFDAVSASPAFFLIKDRRHTFLLG